MTAYEYQTLTDRRARGERLTRSEAARLAWEDRKAERRIKRRTGFTASQLAALR